MKIIFLTHQIPYPAISGGLFKTSKLIEYLSKKHEVILFVTDPDATKENEEAFVKSVSLKNIVRNPFRLKRSGANFFLSILKRIPLSVHRNFDVSFAKKIELAAKDCDLIFVDHFLMFQYVPENFKGKVVLHEHNAEYAIWERYAALNTNPLMKIMLKFESNRIAAFERNICKRADWILCSPNDRQKLIEIGADANKFKETLHLGDMELLDFPISNVAQLEDRIVFIGTLTWQANIDGLVWFLESIWPLVKLRYPLLKLDIIGKFDNPAPFFKWMNDKDIMWHGFVMDINPFYDKAKIFIAPLRFGSGIKVKVVNALYRGLPTVTTTVGVEGMELKNREEISWGDTPDEFAQAIDDLLKDKELWFKHANRGREFSIKNLSWDKALQCLDEIIV